VGQGVAIHVIFAGEPPGVVLARYDRALFHPLRIMNRHALTHYKGNLVCDFCPGYGTPTEKSFNRVDVFTRLKLFSVGVP
jgi:hypothetical protein